MSIRESVSPEPVSAPLRPAVPWLGGWSRLRRGAARRRAPWIPITIIAIMVSMALFAPLLAP